MKLSSYLYEDLILMNLRGRSKEELIENLLAHVAQRDQRVKKREDEILKAVLKRENEISTFVGHGLMIPHTRLENFDEFIVAIGIVGDPVEETVVGSGEKDEIRIVILLLGDVIRNKNMLKTMSAFSKIAMKEEGLLEKIKIANTSEEIIKLIDRANIEVDKRVRAEDILNENIKPVCEDTTLEDVARRFIVENMSGLPVVDKNNKFLGEITERELIEFGMPKYITILDDVSFLTVGEPFEEYLSKEKTTIIKDLYRKEKVITVDRKAPIMEISFLMVNKSVTRIYVVEDNFYYGMIERSDIIKKVLHI